MLQQQINYWTLQETKRHNLVQEQLTGEQIAVAKEGNQINWFTAKEAQRHNIQNEGVSWTNANENIRHNQVTEGIQNRTLNETIRHNKQQEGIGWANAAANITSANAARTNAIVNVGKLKLERDYQPYRLAESTSRSAKNLADVTLSGFTAVKLTADANKSNAEAAKTKKETKYIVWDKINNTGNMIGNLLKGVGAVRNSGKKGVRR